MPRELTPLLTAHDLALAYTRAVCAYWCGDSDALSKFEAWLVRFWSDCPPEPLTNPSAICPHGAAGRCIHWFDMGSSVLGYVPGKRGCYRIPRTVLPPSFADHSLAAIGGPLAA